MATSRSGAALSGRVPMGAVSAVLGAVLAPRAAGSPTLKTGSGGGVGAPEAAEASEPAGTEGVVEPEEAMGDEDTRESSGSCGSQIKDGERLIPCNRRD